MARPIDEWPGALTPEGQRTDSPFRASWSDTVELLEREVRHLAGPTATVVVQLAVTEGDCRLDGWIKANARPAHPGVVLAFDSKHGPLRYSTDKHRSSASWFLPGWQANVRAVALGLEALRKVDRYGIARGGEQYRGWKAIPSTTGSGGLLLLFRTVGQPPRPNINVKALYRLALFKAHPDHGGTGDLLQQVMDAGRKLGVA
ncbi:MAG: molecular chaperone DnaJ [Actinomycetota bacterium]|nr:molecular chaperone DnaJ [Actinomycetota bacterium]